MVNVAAAFWSAGGRAKRRHRYGRLLPRGRGPMRAKAAWRYASRRTPNRTVYLQQLTMNERFLREASRLQLESLVQADVPEPPFESLNRNLMYF
jgi:hypothetical protein